MGNLWETIGKPWKYHGNSIPSRPLPLGSSAMTGPKSTPPAGAVATATSRHPQLLEPTWRIIIVITH